jgi:exodeoxyribonuclease VII small subunit
MAADMAADAERPVAELTFEDALKELERVVGELESGQVPLEESIALYRRGAELRRHCEAKLKAAEEQVAQIAQGEGGEVTARPVEIS